jgi:hypothetical protein
MRVISIASVLAAVLSAGIANADQPRPAGFVNKCTLENAEKDGDECLGFRNLEDACRGYLASQGFCARCMSGNYNEYVCRPRGGPALIPDWKKQCTPPPRDTKKPCNCNPVDPLCECSLDPERGSTVPAGVPVPSSSPLPTAVMKDCPTPATTSFIKPLSLLERAGCRCGLSASPERGAMPEASLPLFLAALFFVRRRFHRR